jgi:DNA-binding response OmpR family regulator
MLGGLALTNVVDVYIRRLRSKIDGAMRTPTVQTVQAGLQVGGTGDG